MSKKNYNSLDIAKLFMAVCVVAIHTNPFYFCNNTLIVNLYNQIISWAVPFFFICSGFLIGKKVNFSSDNAYLPIKKSAVKMLKLYVIWSVIYLPPAIAERLGAGKSLAYNLLHYAKGFIINGEHYNSWILWYLLSSFYALALVAFLVKRRLSLKKITAIGAGLFVCWLLLNTLGDYESQLPAAIKRLMPLIDATVSRGKPLQGFLYIPLGMCLAKAKIKVPYCGIAFALCFALSFFISPTLGRALTPFTVSALFGMVVSADLPDSKAYPVMRKLSTGIYFIHLYCWMLVYLVLYGKKTYGPTAFFATVLLSAALTGVWIVITAKIKKRKAPKAHAA